MSVGVYSVGHSEEEAEQAQLWGTKKHTTLPRRFTQLLDHGERGGPGQKEVGNRAMGGVNTGVESEEVPGGGGSDKLELSAYEGGVGSGSWGLGCRLAIASARVGRGARVNGISGVPPWRTGAAGLGRTGAAGLGRTGMGLVWATRLGAGAAGTYAN